MKTGKDSGFTLVEMLIVVALAGILMAIAVPSLLHSISHVRLQRSARDVATQLHAARLKSISTNKKYKLEFVENAYPTADTFRLAYWNTATSAWAYDSVSAAFSLNPNVDIGTPSTSFSVYFYTNGSATDTDNGVANDVGICLRNQNVAGDDMKITVSGFSGMITIVTGC